MRNHRWSGGRPRQDSKLRSRLRRPVLHVARTFPSTLQSHADPPRVSLHSLDTPVRRGSPHKVHHEGVACGVGGTSSDGLEFWSMSVVPLSEVKARLSEIAEEVERTHERVHITRNGREYVVLISAADLASLEATLELLSDPQATAEIRQAEADLAGGKGTTGEEMAAVMEERRRRERRGA